MSSAEADEQAIRAWAVAQAEVAPALTASQVHIVVQSMTPTELSQEARRAS